MLKYLATLLVVVCSSIDVGARVRLFAPEQSSVLQRPSLTTPYDQTINRHAATYGIDPDLVRAVMIQESAGKPNARSNKGARGLMQLMPATAKRFGVTNITEPTQNIEGGCKYLRFLLKRFDNDVRLTLAAYNAGEGAVRRAGGIPDYPETIDYVKKITARYGTEYREREPAAEYTLLAVD